MVRVMANVLQGWHRPRCCTRAEMMAGLRLLPDGCQLRPLARCLRGGYAEGGAESTEILPNVLYFSRPGDVWPIASLVVQLTTSHANLGQKEGNGADPRRNFRS